jgi:predicted nucleotidyltransferase
MIDTVTKEKLYTLCRSYGIEQMSFFGSILRDDFSPLSDIDILVKFPANKRFGLFQLGRLHTELEALLNRKVDLLTENGLNTMNNPLKQTSILSSTSPIYVS